MGEGRGGEGRGGEGRGERRKGEGRGGGERRGEGRGGGRKEGNGTGDEERTEQPADLSKCVVHSVEEFPAELRDHPLLLPLTHDAARRRQE